MTNAFRPDVAASQLAYGEAQTHNGGKPSTLKGSVSKRCWGASGGWRRNDGKVGYMNQGDLSGDRTVFMQRTDRRHATIPEIGVVCGRPRAEEPAGQESERP